ncbi:GPI ethanolamine phosphate transferase 1-like isoform X1 [Mya arenaria]|uniref:GPI ethanolamine phosphate transferase 1-like isoform X1 n=1 Tax=Mya arenaria TaxID=6604 RepID=UPI0022E1DAAA|nr:GPI ethanolamine phosphate transferase 1-like isoform X1 [Mya arenaria]XP_052799974.1 GPI ethanolamine phosphate transferase 1-like isoform X1 [Mya arenaria]
MKLWVIVAVGLLIHLVFFFSVFEVFFATPLVTDLTPHKSPLPPPAKRLVFIVADGLRADKILQIQPDGKSAAPFLRKIIQEKGGWGISHAAVPTATRPGHVALTAGFYEDPTSVAKDLQGKEVVFDTVFNESQYTWSWDTPKFLAKVTGGNQDRMFSDKYPGHMKYLAGINAKDMDTWVFDEFQKLFLEAKEDTTLQSKLSNERILFFLHLGGLDHSGYIVRPSSPSYLEHIRFVDDGVQKLVSTMEQHYGSDGKTAYVFTSDHGMTDWGAHGDGTADETLTPLIVWGPGLRKPSTETTKYADGLSEAWGLQDIRRTDINQASMAGLLAALVGIPFPKNAVLPMPDNVFDVSDEEMAQMLYANLQQLLAQVQGMREERETRSIKFAFTPFQPLSAGTLEDIKDRISRQLASKQFKEAIQECQQSISLALRGIRYYTTYDRNHLWFAVVSGYVGWMVYLVSLMFEENDVSASMPYPAQLSRRYKAGIIFFFLLLAVITFVVLFVQHTVWTQYIYVLLPYPIWLAVCLRFDVYRQMLVFSGSLKPLLPYIALTFLGLQAGVMGFYYKQLMVLPILCFAAWPWLSKQDLLDKGIMIQWSASCVAMGVFALIPTGTRELQFNLVVIGGVLAIIVAFYVMRSFANRQLARRKQFLIYGFQILMMALAIFIMRHTAALAANDKRTPLVSQILSWIIFILAIVEPFLVTTDIRCRLFAVALAWMGPYILLGISYEVIFMVIMCWNLYIWMLVEARLATSYMELPTAADTSKAASSKATPDNPAKILESVDFVMLYNESTNGKSLQGMVRADLRRVFYAINLIILSLYGTGNVTSVNSFDPAAVFCFLTISDPPTMGIFIVLKIATPFIYVMCAMVTVGLVTRVPMKSYSLLFLLMGDFIAMQFFMFVTDEGPWDHVGATVSHYVIFQIIHMVLMIFYGFSYLLTSCSICCFNQRQTSQRT